MNYAGQRYLLIDITRFGGQAPGESGLVAFRWDAPSSSWVFSGAAKHVVNTGLSTTITTFITGGVPVAFVTGDFGVLSYNLASIAAGTISAQTFIDYHSQNLKKGSWGMVATRGRLIVFYDHWDGNLPPSVSPEIAVYNWMLSGPHAGTINHVPVASFTATDIVPTWQQTFRGRYVPIDEETGHVYVCNGNKVYRLLFNENTVHLTFDAVWKSDNDGAIQDCRVYTFGNKKRMLVAKLARKRADQVRSLLIQPSVLRHWSRNCCNPKSKPCRKHNY